MNYLHIDRSLLIAGVVLKDDPRSSKARSKMLRTVGPAVVPKQHLAAITDRVRDSNAAFESDVEARKQQVIADYRETGAYRQDIVDLLRPSLEQTFAQVHDYRQLTSQIIQHVNVLLVTTAPNVDLDQQLSAVSPSVRAIYWAARLMEFKLESALFLVYPERINDPQRKRTFRLHGAVRKYLSIYEPLIELKSLRKFETGQSFARIEANPDAVGVIPHAYLDNAVKYAPDGSDITVHFDEDADTITLSVTSLGPRITSADRGHLFDLFYRGSAALNSQEDGTGFGLGLAQHVAEAIEAELSYEQASTSTIDGYFQTTFTARFKMRSGEETPSLYRTRVRVRGGVRQ